MLLEQNKSKKIYKIALIVLISCFGIIIGMKYVILGVVGLISQSKASRFASVGCEIDVVEVTGSNGGYNKSLVDCNGERTFIFSGDTIYEYINDDELKEIRQIDTYVKYMGVTEKYLVFSIHNGGTYRIDINSWDEKELLSGKSVDNIVVIGNDFFLVQSGEYINDKYQSRRSLYMFSGDDSEGVEIPLEGDFAICSEVFAVNETVFSLKQKEYIIYRDEHQYIAIKKNEEIYPLTMDASFEVNGKIVSFDGTRYTCGNEQKLINIEGYNQFGVHTGLSSRYGDEIYAIIQLGSGYKAGSSNPDKVYCDMLVNVSPVEGTENIVYTGDKSSRIVGYNIEKNIVVLYNRNGEVCSRNLDTEEVEILMKLNHNSTVLTFQWDGERLFVFDGRLNGKLIGSCSVE